MWELRVIVDTKAKCNLGLAGKGAKKGLASLLGDVLTMTSINRSIPPHFG